VKVCHINYRGPDFFETQRSTVSVAISAIGSTGLIFIEAGVKINYHAILIIFIHHKNGR